MSRNEKDAEFAFRVSPCALMPLLELVQERGAYDDQQDEQDQDGACAESAMTIFGHFSFPLSFLLLYLMYLPCTMFGREAYLCLC